MSGNPNTMQRVLKQGDDPFARAMREVESIALSSHSDPGEVGYFMLDFAASLAVLVIRQQPQSDQSTLVRQVMKAIRTGIATRPGDVPIKSGEALS